MRVWWGLALAGLVACGGDVDVDEDGFVAAEDCDDADPGVYPGAPEQVGDGVDQDCDGVDACYADADADGFGSEEVVAGPEGGCDASGYAAVSGDCDDADETEHPDVTWYADVDQDGYGDPSSASVCARAEADDVLDGSDCDDADETEYPGLTWYADVDEDGFGDPQSTSPCERAHPDDVLDDTDCDDLDEDERPGATWYADVDQDGYGDADSAADCERAAPEDVLDASDCDDLDGAVNPGAAERCDGVDTDCDPLTGEDGLVGYLREGSYEDVTAAFAGGGPTSPVAYSTPVLGGTLRFCAGTFYTNILLDSNMTVEGAGADRTTLHGGGGGSVLVRGHQGQTHAVRDLRITGGVADTGGGLFFSSENTVTVERCVIEGNTARRGGGIGALSTTLTVIDTVIRDNVVTGTGVAGGGLFVGQNSPYALRPVVLEAVSFSGNEATAGTGGAIGVSASTVAGSQMSFSDNDPTDYAHVVGSGDFGSAATVSCSATSCVSF